MKLSGMGNRDRDLEVERGDHRDSEERSGESAIDVAVSAVGLTLLPVGPKNLTIGDDNS
jgi:hypothetical protein